MDWRSVRFDWNRARAFLVTAEEGSLSAAARALNMAQPTLGRQVTALEEELGVTLFERVGRGLVLTAAGTQLLEHVRKMGEAANAMSLVATGQTQDVAGNVAITCSEIYAEWLLPPFLKQLHRIAPGITLEVVAANEIRDLKRREADIAIRNARPEQADLIGKFIGDDSGTLYGAADYLATLPPMTCRADLVHANFIGLDKMRDFYEQLAAQGFPVSVDNVRIVASNHPLHCEFTRQGLGVGFMPCGYGDRDPKLARALPEDETMSYPVWLVAHRELRTSPRVRLVWDLLADMLPGLLKG